MLVTIERNGHVRDVRLHHLTRSTIDDLAAACGLPTTIGLVVDDHHYPPTTPLLEVAFHPGSRIVTPNTTAALPRHSSTTATGAPSVAEIRHVAGWDASDRLPLTPGDHGMASAAKLGLRHSAPTDPDLFLRVTADGARVKPGSSRRVHVNSQTPLETSNARDQVITANSDAFVITDPAHPAHGVLGQAVGATIWNRPPRATPPPPLQTVPVPERPKPARGRQALSWIMMAAPVPIGIVMAILWSPIFALFILMSPILMLGQWVEGRNASKRDRRRFGHEFASAMDAVRSDITTTIASERDRRRAVQPDVATLRMWAEIGHPRLWERRRTHDDFLTLSAGFADVVAPLTARGPGAESFPEAIDELTTPRYLSTVPLTCELGDQHQAVGIIGPPALRLALARSLILQAATLHGPADLDMALISDDERTSDWDWLKWLPHLQAGAGNPRLVTSLDDIADALPPASTLEQTVRGETTTDGPIMLAVIDSLNLIANPTSPLRNALADTKRSVRGIVLAERADQLPSACTCIIEIDHAGRATAHFPINATAPIPLLAAGLAAPTAHAWARSLARFNDPEATGTTGGSSEAHSLIELLGPLDAETVGQRWAELPADPTPAGPVGLTDLGPLHIDLATDGPHGLVAGTTGSGKSELLRSMVVSMAFRVDPDHLNFVLIDFKGGGAFDVCADLPHVVSVVTDLDEHLAERALRCLKAELRLREERLREAGATDLGEYLNLDDHDRLPRLVVIIDEFATLAAELPDFLDSLVDIAQRGRSLGVHLILATQRPSGVLDNKVRANTNLRIALRVQDDADSEDVIGTNQASKLSRQQPGRAYARFGQSEITEFQAALVTGEYMPDVERSLSSTPFTLAADDDTSAATPTPPHTNGAGAGGPATDVELIVDVINQAFRAHGYEQPREPWPDPLPTTIACETLTPDPESPDDPNRRGETVAVPIGIVDLPDRQLQQTVSWNAQVGNTLIYAIDAEDITDTIATISLGLARTLPPSEFHLYGLEYGAKQLAPLEDLPHCGGIVDGGDVERTLRLVGLLAEEIANRRADTGGSHPLIMLAIDNYAGLTEQLEQAGEFDAMSHMSQIVRDGAAVNVFSLLGARSERGIPLRLANVVEHKMLFRLVDRNAYAAFGLRPRDVPNLTSGSWIDSTSHELAQLARYQDGDIAAAVTQLAATASDHARPLPVQTIGEHYTLADLETSLGNLSDETWKLPIAVDSATLTTALLQLASTEHALIVGGAGSGKSTALTAIARSARQHDPDLTIIGVAPRRSPLRSCDALTHLAGRSTPAHVLEALVDRSRVLVLVDDADMLPPDQATVLGRLAEVLVDDRHIIASCRPDYPKSFESWVHPLRRNQSGIALQPGPNDGDAFRTMLPLNRPERFPVGRAFLVLNGVSDMVQVAIDASDNNAELDEATAADIASSAAKPTPQSVDTKPSAIDLGLGSFTTVPQDLIDQQTEGWETPASISLGLDEFATDTVATTDNEPPNHNT